MYNKIIHLIASVLAFGVPIVFMTHSTALDLTVGGVLNAIYLWASQVIRPTQTVK